MDSNSDKEIPSDEVLKRRECWTLRIALFTITFLMSFIGPVMINSEFKAYGKIWVHDYDKYQGHPDEVHVMNVSPYVLENPMLSLYCQDVESPIRTKITQTKPWKLRDALSNDQRSYFYGFGEDGNPVHIIVHPTKCQSMASDTYIDALPQ